MRENAHKLGQGGRGKEDGETGGVQSWRPRPLKAYLPVVVAQWEGGMQAFQSHQ